MNIINQSVVLGSGMNINLETGKLAKQADGSVVLSVDGTMLLATVVANHDIKPDVDFLPLSVEYQEKYFSAGKFPGGFFKREGRLNEHEILTSRIIDRSLRPMFPEDYHAEIQVIVYLISSNKTHQPDALATVAASAALMCSDIPFPDAVASVRVIYSNGQYIINPTFAQMQGADLDLMVSGTANSINMVEGEMNEVSEEIMVEALKHAHQAIQNICAALENLRKQVGKTTREYEKQVIDPELITKVTALAESKIYDIAKASLSKEKRSEGFKAIRKEVTEAILAENPEFNKMFDLKMIFGDLEYNVVRRMILNDRIRLDGRKMDEIRPIWSEVSYLPFAHGSAVFTRGETQSLATVTLGSKLDEQIIDTALEAGFRSFMLHYNFPPFSTGEVKMMRGASRREVGHGNLAERALKVMLPEQNEYTIRIVSEILESNGSSSMASVCAGCLALMDAGVKLKNPVSGIAMGLITDGEKFAVLSDILGDEDHLGDMDFKVTGTAKGITACQMDIKIRGLSFEIMIQALMQAKKGREHILNEMLKTLAEPRQELSQYAPRIEKLVIPASTIGAVIGTGGKTIQEIQRVTGTTIHIEEADNKGHVTIASPDLTALQKALEWIKGLVFPPTVGEVFMGTVKGMKESGAFVEFSPGKEGWLHISEISHKRVEKIEDVLSVGDQFEVKIIEVDTKTNKIRLSRKALLPAPEKTNQNFNKNKS